MTAARRSPRSKAQSQTIAPPPQSTPEAVAGGRKSDSHEQARRSLIAQLELWLKDKDIDYFAYGRLPEPGDTDTPEAAISLANNYPPDWIARYVADGLYSHDPARTHAPSNSRIFRWDMPDLEPQERDFVAIARYCGLRAGASVPLHAEGSCFVVSFVAHDAAVLDDDTLETLWLEAHRFHERFQNPVYAKAVKPILDGNALEVLKWLSAGKTPDEIALLLGITRAGVYWLIADAKKKLSARNTLHLVAKAIRLRILPI